VKKELFKIRSHGNGMRARTEDSVIIVILNELVLNNVIQEDELQTIRRNHK